jgi:hypothetical protein
MKKLFLLSAIIITFAVGFGCSSARPGEFSSSDRLTEKEQEDLINFARFFLTRGNKFATSDQKTYINFTKPEFTILYTGPKQGKATMSWKLKTKTIRAIASGKLLSDDMRWQVKVAKHSNIKITKNAPLNSQRPQFTRKDVEALKKIK